MITGRRLDVTTSRPTQFIDITAMLQQEVSAAGLVNGRVHLQSLHTTLALAVNENEPLLLLDLEQMLERIAPGAATYQHDDFDRRIGIGKGEPINGYAHCQSVLLHPSHTALVESGRLLLGRWQSIFAVELSGPRRRQIALQFDGEFARSQPDRDRELVELELERQLLIDPEPVRTPMRRLVDAGGKRLRPALVMVASRLGPRRDALRAAELAAAIELIHDATLVHDDYVDEAGTRRDRPTVAAAEGPRRAIEVGDYYFAKATRLIAELGNPAVTTTIAEALEAICVSQIEDLQLRGRYPGDLASYLRVVRGKTAALIAAACTAGAQLAEADSSLVERVRRYGERLGIAFQMADDLLDYSDQAGKPAGTDIRQRVLSLPLIYATEDGSVGPRLRELLEGDLGDAAVRQAQELVTASGALERVGVDARGMVADAVTELEAIDLDGVRPALAAIAMAAVDRTR